MLDIKFLRENPDIVKQNIRNKFQDEKLSMVDEVIALDKENREIKQEVEALRAERNKASKEIGKLMGQGKKEGRGHWDNIGGLKHKHPHPQHLSYPFTPQFRSPWFPSTQKTWCVGGKSLGNNPPQGRLRGCTLRSLKLCHLKRLDPSSIIVLNKEIACFLSHTLSLWAQQPWRRTRIPILQQVPTHIGSD